MAPNGNISEARRYRRLIESVGHTVSVCVMAIGSIVLLLLAMHFLIGAGFWLERAWQHPADRADGGDMRALMPVYKDAPEDRQFFMDPAKIHFEPYIHWRRDSIESKYINVDTNGVRRTIKSPVSGAVRVFMFGGSTTWGSGVADAYTVPSQLQQRLGSGFDVYNYAETAFVTVQELNLLLRELARGNVPDVVVFYDGFNDTYAGVYSPGVPRDPQNERQRHETQTKPIYHQIIARTNMYILFDRMRSAIYGGNSVRWDRAVSPKVAENAGKTLDAYEAFVFQARALARAYGFKVFFFWQPNLATGTRNAQPYEKQILERDSPLLIEVMRLVHQDARKRFSQREDENIYFLGHVLDDVDEPLYIDLAHLGPRGNAIIAEEIFKRLRGRI